MKFLIRWLLSFEECTLVEQALRAQKLNLEHVSRVAATNGDVAVLDAHLRDWRVTRRMQLLFTVDSH